MSDQPHIAIEVFPVLKGRGKMWDDGWGVSILLLHYGIYNDKEI